MSRRFLFPLLCVLLVWLVWSQHAQAGALLRVLGRAQVLPLVCAILFQLGTLLNQPALFQSLYELVGLEAKWRELVTVVLAGRFINVVAPAAGLGETALLFEQAKRRDWDYGQVSLATTLYFALNFAVFGLILVLGLVLLSLHGDLKSSEVVATALLFAGLAIGLAALFAVVREPQRFAAWAISLSARLPLSWRARLLSEQALQDTITGFANSLRTLGRSPRKIIRPVIHAVLVDALEIAVLAACLRAFGVGVTPVLLVASYAVGTLFTIVSISPQGLGAVEGALGATLVSLGVSAPHAIAVVLAYRGLSFWLPLVVGLVATRCWSRDFSASIPKAGHSIRSISAITPF